MKKFIVISALAFTAAAAPHLDAAFTFREGKLTIAERGSDSSLAERFQHGVACMEAQDWKSAVPQFEIVAMNAPESLIGQVSQYNLGICAFELEEYEMANIAFTEYLQCSTNPVYFQKAVEYKYFIAEAFKNGASRRPFGMIQFPKFLSGKDLAIEIYDQVIAAIPSGDMAASALYAKASLLWEMRDFRGSIESYQMLIKRFPKHELTPEAYLQVTCVYLDQCRSEFQNPDLLAFAEIACRKFKVDFPGDEARIARAEYNVLYIREQYAHGLFTTAQFYERTKNRDAALIYYQKAMLQFPDTQVAKRCRSRLQVICPQFVEEFDKNCEQIPLTTASN